jgi:hypothetical protein
MAFSVDQIRNAAAPPDAAELERLRAEAPQGGAPVVLAQLSAQYSPAGDAAQVTWWVGTTAPNVHILEAYLFLALDENTPVYWNWTSNQEPGSTVSFAVFGQTTMVQGLGQLYAGKTLQVIIRGSYQQGQNQGAWGPFQTTLPIPA